MKYLYFFILSVLILNPISAQTETSSETSTYYFIRHAEKDRSNASEKNPHLTEIGKARAEHWSAVLSSIHFDAVYSTDYHRTRETALPTATKNNLELSLYRPKHIDLKNFLKETKGKTVLIVGHSNTIPHFVNDVIGEKKYVDIEDDNNGNLYIVTIINKSISDQVLLIN
ncbi:SixA phosphatase family protein [Lacinutrix iliipiscaria]|uniref:SixA phosphatase family protein n=1 Tax=Lacinutrix iliipiscaria TaxID=1230532 RepID=A0ABW5WM90_9FLAO